jgi:hypothetical protein
MMGRLNRDQGQLFYCFNLEEAVPDDHQVRRIAGVLDLSWVHTELASHYSALGRPSIDPVLMIRGAPAEEPIVQRILDSTVVRVSARPTTKADAADRAARRATKTAAETLAQKSPMLLLHSDLIGLFAAVQAQSHLCSARTR